MIRWFAMLVFAVTVGLTVAANKVYAAGHFNVQVIVNVRTSDSDALVKALRRELASRTSPQNIVLLKTVSVDQFRKNSEITGGSNLLVTIGTVPTLEIARQNISTPVISTLIPRVSFESIIDKHINTAKAVKDRDISVIYLDQPFKRRFALIRHLLPDAREVGVVLGPSTVKYKGSIVEAAGEMGFRLNSETVETVTQLVPALERVLKSSHVLMAVLDPLVFNRSNAQTVLLTSYRYRVPIIGISPAYTNAGALAAVYSTPDQIGKQLAQEIQQIAVSQTKGISRRSYPDRYSIKINRHIAHSLGIRFVDERELERLLQRGKH